MSQKTKQKATNCARCSKALSPTNASEWALCYLCQRDLAATGENASTSVRLTEWVDNGAPKIARCVKCMIAIPRQDAAAQEGRCKHHWETLKKSRANIVVARAYRHTTPLAIKEAASDAPPITGGTPGVLAKPPVEGVIQKGIPLPSIHGIIPVEYPWAKMAVNDSFWMNKPPNRASKLAIVAGRQNKMKFAVRRDGKGARVWRIK